MFLRVQTINGKRYYSIVETRREAGKMVQEIILYMGRMDHIGEDKIVEIGNKIMELYPDRFVGMGSGGGHLVREGRFLALRALLDGDWRNALERIKDPDSRAVLARSMLVALIRERSNLEHLEHLLDPYGEVEIERMNPSDTVSLSNILALRKGRAGPGNRWLVIPCGDDLGTTLVMGSGSLFGCCIRAPLIDVMKAMRTAGWLRRKDLLLVSEVEVKKAPIQALWKVPQDEITDLLDRAEDDDDVPEVEMIEEIDDMDIDGDIEVDESGPDVEVIEEEPSPTVVMGTDDLVVLRDPEGARVSSSARNGNIDATLELLNELYSQLRRSRKEEKKVLIRSRMDQVLGIHDTWRYITLGEKEPELNVAEIMEAERNDGVVGLRNDAKLLHEEAVQLWTTALELKAEIMERYIGPAGDADLFSLDINILLFDAVIDSLCRPMGEDAEDPIEDNTLILAAIRMNGSDDHLKKVAMRFDLYSRIERALEEIYLLTTTLGDVTRSRVAYGSSDAAVIGRALGLETIVT